MGLEPSEKRALRMYPRIARAISFLGMVLLLVGFLFPIESCWSPVGMLLAKVAKGIHSGSTVYLVGASLAAVVATFFLWQPITGIAEAAQFSPARVAWRFARILPYGLLPLAAAYWSTHLAGITGRFDRKWADAVLAADPIANDWAAFSALCWWLAPLLTLTCVSTAICVIWWSCHERLAILEEMDNDDLRPRADGFMSFFLMSGGVFGGRIAQRLFGKTRNVRLLRPWLVWLGTMSFALWLILRFNPTFTKGEPDTATALARALDILLASRDRQVVADQLMKLTNSKDEASRKRGQYAISLLGEILAPSVPKLIADISRAARPERDKLIVVLDGIDSDWPKSDGAAVVIPALCEIVADVSWADDVWATENGPRTPTISGPDMIRRVLGEKTALDIDATEYRGTRVLNDIGGGRIVLRALQILNQIDPNWEATDAGQKAIGELKAVWEAGKTQVSPGQWHAADALLRRIDPEFRGTRVPMPGAKSE